MAKVKYLRPKQKTGGAISVTYHNTFSSKEEAERRGKKAASILRTGYQLKKTKTGYAVYLA